VKRLLSGGALTGAAVILAVALAVGVEPGAAPLSGVEEAVRIFEAAGAAYERGDFQGAADGYERLAQSGLGDAPVYYNLGNSFYRLGRSGDAIQAYEIARKLDPADAEIRENLLFVTSQIVDRVDEPGDGEGPIATLWDWHGRLPASAATGVFLAAWWLMNLCLAAALFAPWRRWRRLGSYSLTGALLAVMLTGAVLGLLVYRRDAVMEGIIRTSRVDLQSMPNGGITLTTIHEGLKVRVRGIRGDWVEVTLPNGFRGWIPRDAVGVI
jgi:tetratricopeptide (TPR) repeat protein